MPENVLKKQFAEKDIQRVRNLVKGKAGEKITHGIGYTKEIEDHVEGDVWQEDGRTWTIKDGIKQNITKLDKFKKICPFKRAFLVAIYSIYINISSRIKATTSRRNRTSATSSGSKCFSPQKRATTI